jgi:ribosomal protein L40E
MKNICGKCGSLDSYKEVTEGGRSVGLFLLLCCFMIVPGLLYWGFAKKATTKNVCKQCGAVNEEVGLHSPLGQKLFRELHPNEEPLKPIKKQTWHGFW